MKKLGKHKTGESCLDINGRAAPERRWSTGGSPNRTRACSERLAIMVDLKDAVTDTMAIDAKAPPAWSPAPAAATVVEVVVTAGTVKLTGAGGADETRDLAPKQGRYIRRGTVQTQQGVAGSPRVIAIELKSSTPIAQPLLAWRPGRRV